eukprot:13751864-Alexandrium_andersonii.AAC.1
MTVCRGGSPTATAATSGQPPEGCASAAGGRAERCQGARLRPLDWMVASRRPAPWRICRISVSVQEEGT